VIHQQLLPMCFRLMTSQGRKRQLTGII